MKVKGHNLDQIIIVKKVVESWSCYLVVQDIVYIYISTKGRKPKLNMLPLAWTMRHMTGLSCIIRILKQVGTFSVWFSCPWAWYSSSKQEALRWPSSKRHLYYYSSPVKTGIPSSDRWQVKKNGHCLHHFKAVLLLQIVLNLIARFFSWIRLFTPKYSRFRW